MLYKYIRCWELYSRVRISPRFLWDHWARIRWCIGLPPKGTNPWRKMLPSGKLTWQYCTLPFIDSMRFTCQKLVVSLLERVIIETMGARAMEPLIFERCQLCTKGRTKICALQQRGLRCTAGRPWPRQQPSCRDPRDPGKELLRRTGRAMVWDITGLNKPPIWELFIPPIYGDLGKWLSLFYPH